MDGEDIPLGPIASAGDARALPEVINLSVKKFEQLAGSSASPSPHIPLVVAQFWTCSIFP